MIDRISDENFRVVRASTLSEDERALEAATAGTRVSPGGILLFLCYLSRLRSGWDVRPSRFVRESG